ncbi:XRE family transcriptional regulator [Mesobacillus subterraneus]|uniref:XRE family transcriptional regulator n=1 Tax=Mesobacillus subterraneus TaxID=285983 RepID=A0A427TT08_9BACI|nr:helix-turn-helix transcriptional regulator [Mesobacillus subterraneus]RSD27556.1 XRE family transcriptional regulator [Mesobacillus subterraneus]
MTAIGHNIKMCRERVGMSQEELALKIRVGTQTIRRYESGEQTPKLQTILKISTALDVPASELMGQIYYAAPPELEQKPSNL